MIPMDGTFESCLEQFSQVYIILAAMEGDQYGEYEAYTACVAFVERQE